MVAFGEYHVHVQTVHTNPLLEVPLGGTKLAKLLHVHINI
jgi:hypothetical protein